MPSLPFKMTVLLKNMEGYAASRVFFDLPRYVGKIFLDMSGKGRLKKTLVMERIMER